MKRRYIVLLAGVMAVLFTFTACTSSTVSTSNGTAVQGSDPATTDAAVSDGIVSSKDTLVISRTNDPGSVEPYKSTGTSEGYCVDTVLETLFFYDEDGVAQPKLVEEYWYEDDGATLLLKLRQGVTFHNGEPMTVDDVLYSFDYFSQGSQANALNFVDFKNIEAVDDSTIKVPLLQKVAYSASALTRVYVFSKEYMETHGDDVNVMIIGTGPYTLADYTSGDSITVEKYDGYWGEPAYLNRIVFRFIPETSVAMIELETGGIDFALSCLGSDVKKAQENPDGEVQPYFSSAMRYNMLAFNCANTYTNELLVRQAISYAIDKEALLKGAYEGLGTIAQSQVPNGTWGHDDTLDTNPTYTYNPEKAKELLAEAGYADGITLQAAIDTSTASVMEQIQNMLAEVGISVEIQQYDQTTCVELLRSSLDGWNITIRQYGNEGDCGPGLMNQTHPSNSGAGKPVIFHYFDDLEAAGYGAKLDEAVTLIDDDARKAAYCEAQQIFMENAFCVPLRYFGDTYLHASNLRGFVKSGNRPIFNWCYFE